MTENKNIFYLAPNFENADLEFKHTIRDSLLFIPGTYEMFSLGNGVTLVTGKTIADPVGRSVPHAIVFQKGLWTPESAKVWLNEHKDSFAKDKNKETELYNIEGVDIFAAGNWNGDEFSIEDLDNMVKAFDSTKHKFKPFLKLGHDDNQEMLKREGLPAAGWIDKIYRKGNKLLADFVDIPEKIYNLIKNKAYRKVSSEIYHDIEIEKKRYPKMLSAVALLGAEHPAVSCLDDIMSMYANFNANMLKSYSSDKYVSKTYDYKGDKKMEKSENEVKLEVELENTKKQLEEIQSKFSSVEKETKEKEEKIVELEKFKLEQEEKLHQAGLDSQVSDLEKENICLPSMKQFVRDILDSKKTTYKIEEKEASRFEMLKQVLKLAFSSKVNLSENSLEGDKSGQNADETQLEEMRKYANEHKVSMAVAYKQIKKQK